jgi:hypothetical protein
LRSATKRAGQKPRYNSVRIVDMTKLLRLTECDGAMRSFPAVVVARQNCFSATEIGFVLRKMTKQPHMSVK